MLPEEVKYTHGLQCVQKIILIGFMILIGSIEPSYAQTQTRLLIRNSVVTCININRDRQINITKPEFKLGTESVIDKVGIRKWEYKELI